MHVTRKKEKKGSGVSPEDSFETGAGNSFRNIRKELQAELAELEVGFP